MNSHGLLQAIGHALSVRDGKGSDILSRMVGVNSLLINSIRDTNSL